MLKFKSLLSVNVEGKEYRSIAPIEKIQEGFLRISNSRAKEYKEVVVLVRDFTDEVFGEGSFDTMTEGTPKDIYIAFQLIEYLNEECQKQLENFTNAYGGNMVGTFKDVK